jgi:predicted permease
MAAVPSLPPPSAPTPGPLDLTDLLCALTTQGGVILIGYFSGAIGLVGDGRSISLFVARIALPCLLMQQLATAKLNDLNPCFLLIMLLSKLISLSLGSAIASSLLSGSRLKSAALGGLLASCSNDLAFGLPIIRALYPTLAIYVVLFSLMQNAFVNQVCFFFMEAGIAMEKGTKPGLSLLKTVCRGIVTNALVVAPLIGLSMNFILGGTLPLAFDRLLINIGNAFSCCALFSLGMALALPPSDTGLTAVPAARGWFCVMLLLLLKLVMLPVVASRLQQSVGCSSENVSSGSLADVAYLYGSLPPAPWINSLATSTKHHPKIVARTLAVGAITAFPLLLAGSLTLVSGEGQNVMAAYIFSSVCHLLSLVGTVLLLLPRSGLACLMRRVAILGGGKDGGEKLSNGSLADASGGGSPLMLVLSLDSPLGAQTGLTSVSSVSSSAVLSLQARAKLLRAANFLSVHMRLSPSVWMLTWLQLGFSSTALLGRGSGAWTGLPPPDSAATTLWYTLTNCCRLGALMACVAVVRASSRRGAQGAFPTRKHFVYLGLSAVLVLVLTLPFALDPQPGAEGDMWIQGGMGQLVVDLIFDLAVGAALCLMARRLLSELISDGIAKAASVKTTATPLSIPLTTLPPLSARRAASGAVGGNLPSPFATASRERLLETSGGGGSDVAPSAPTARELLRDEARGGAEVTAAQVVVEVDDVGTVVVAEDEAAAVASGGRGAVGEPEGSDPILSSSTLSPKGWREVAVALSALLRLTLDLVSICAEISVDSGQYAGDGPTSTIAKRGRALLVIRLLSIALTDAQGFLTFLLFAPRFVAAAAPFVQPYSAAKAVRQSYLGAKAARQSPPHAKRRASWTSPPATVAGTVAGAVGASGGGGDGGGGGEGDGGEGGEKEEPSWMPSSGQSSEPTPYTSCD